MVPTALRKEILPEHKDSPEHKDGPEDAADAPGEPAAAADDASLETPEKPEAPAQASRKRLASKTAARTPIKKPARKTR